MKSTDLQAVKAQFFKALANPVRIRLLEHLVQGAARVQDLQKALGLEQPIVSQQGRNDDLLCRGRSDDGRAAAGREDDPEPAARGRPLVVAEARRRAHVGRGFNPAPGPLHA